MKLVRSDSPEVTRCIGSARTRAKRYLPVLLVGLLPNLVILAAALVSLITISMRAAALISAPAFLAWNVWVLWRARSPRLSWVIKTGAGRVYIRLYVGFGRAWKQTDVPDVIVLEASEIASMSIRNTEVFLYGPKPRIVEWLMIKPSQAAVESASNQIPSFLWDTKAPDFWTPDLSERVYWVNNEQRIAVGWKLCHPAVRIFLQQVARECPSIVIGTEERSELDLNGIWHGRREDPDAQQRRMLVQATRLGFGCECTQRISQYRHVPFRKASAYLAEIEQEEARKGHSAMSTTC